MHHSYDQASPSNKISAQLFHVPSLLMHQNVGILTSFCCHIQRWKFLLVACCLFLFLLASFCVFLVTFLACFSNKRNRWSCSRSFSLWFFLFNKVISFKLEKSLKIFRREILALENFLKVPPALVGTSETSIFSILCTSF